MTVVVSGTGWALPGGIGAGDLLEGRSPDATPVDPAARIGKRGLRYKDRATQLGLCAASDALADADLLRDPGLTVGGDSIGVVVSTNYGNVDTVCDVAEVIGRETVTGTSPMDLPNASSNIVASTIAIRFGLRGVNLTLCNGPTSGLDALSWGRLLVSSGRVGHALVVGVETTNAPVERLLGGRAALDGACALVLERPEVARGRGARALAALGGYARRADAGTAVADVIGTLAPGATVGLLLTDDPDGPQGPGAARLAGARRRHVGAALGECSGALGVLQGLVGAAWLSGNPEGHVLATCGRDGDDAVAALLLAGARP